ncbi:glucuronate isomerase [Flavihumibacter solisilvae]|uniref:Uronate isomerase n=1 Tax=Flavihumibacter solisilvae TaxID=1349421 RepID=A0A0C1L881_9BACT|nr:glucuronate isomerase [Flavihumibacter solisilvae]KIC95816.1 glucuronate isomerase [Flavihumibacter solisilvae]
MKPFLNKDFLLNNPTAERLYHDYAALMPIVDYHNHLSPAHIAEDAKFSNLTTAWLYGDHYKWRAMRINGVAEKFITGDSTDEEKFSHWAATVPYTLRNPLYHWTHLELRRYFDVSDLLRPESSKKIYEQCGEMLQQDAFSVQGLLRKMNVKVVCTTDDPTDSLAFHRQLRTGTGELVMLPAFRPDKAIDVSDPQKFNNYLGRLEEVSGMSINTYHDYLHALKKRHDYFAENHCTISDHGLEEMYADDFTESDVAGVFSQLRSGEQATVPAQRKFKSAVLQQLAEWNHEKGWVQQFHLGPLRNNSSRMMRSLGADAGFDSIGDNLQARSLSRFLDRLDSQDKLARTILYNINPSDNEVFATMAGNFNDGSMPGKIQWGSAWWFLDQKDGMTAQLNALSNLGLVSRFIGMLTDSRSFLSIPRHEYFRRILCNLFGEEIERGELPHDIEWTGKIVQDICYNNALDYFGWR